MNKIKKQFSDLRKNTPKHIQWLLLAAAFVVVLILLTLLFTNKNEEQENLENTDEIAIKVSVSPDTIDWANVIVGQQKSQTVKISANKPVKILKIYPAEDVPGLATPQETCTGSGGTVDSELSCTMVLSYAPTVAADVKTTEIIIDWRDVNAPDIMSEQEKVIMVLGAESPQEPEPAPEPEPAYEPEPEPVYEPEPLPEPEPVYTPEPDVSDALDIAMPAIDFSFDPQPVELDEPEYVRPPEACSDFAMPGYNLSGVQSGWIRPSGGAYYFHPFSDTDCSNPTGTYNPDNGIITDIDNPAQKIGTDAEHIGYTTITNGALPQLSNPATTRTANKALQLSTTELNNLVWPAAEASKTAFHLVDTSVSDAVIVGTSSSTAVYSSDPFDRKFVLRQYKPIPATIVSEVRADPSLYNCDGNTCNNKTLPVRATVDRNVYADDGRTIVIPTGTLMLGYVTGELPGPYQTVGRMNIEWYQFILPSGVEFNFHEEAPFSADSQGRVGVPGHGSTDYVEQLVMPMLTAIVPAAVNMIAPIADTFVNQIDLDNNTVVQSGTVRSSELAKQELITAWNQVAQKLLVDAMDNTVPPFSIAAGTRITVYSPSDLIITCGNDNSKECSVQNVQMATNTTHPRNKRNEEWRDRPLTVDYGDPSWVGQVRSFDLSDFCTNQTDDGLWDIDENQLNKIMQSGYDYRTVLAYCQSMNYQAISNAQQDALYQDQQKQFQANYGTVNSNAGGITGISGNQAYNEDILGLTYDDSGAIQNPFESTTSTETAPVENVITCEGGALPDEYGCCPGETYTDMGEQGFNCCPDGGGDCFPPIVY